MEWKGTWKIPLMNDSDTEFVFKKEDSEKDSVSNHQPKNILITEANIHVIDYRRKNSEDSEVESQKDRVDVLETKEKPKEQSKKRRRGRQKKKAKKVEVPLNWQKKASPHPKRQCNLSAEVICPFPENHTPFDVFSVVTNLDPLQKLLVDQSNLYTQQNGREFKTNTDEMKAFLRINYFMTINKLLTIKTYQEWGQYEDNLAIRNVMSRTKFEQTSQKLHFADKQKDEKTDKAY